MGKILLKPHSLPLRYFVAFVLNRFAAVEICVNRKRLLG